MISFSYHNDSGQRSAIMRCTDCWYFGYIGYHSSHWPRKESQRNLNSWFKCNGSACTHKETCWARLCGAKFFVLKLTFPYHSKMTKNTRCRDVNKWKLNKSFCFRLQNQSQKLFSIIFANWQKITKVSESCETVVELVMWCERDIQTCGTSLIDCRRR